jgi:hypothetical protein
VGKVYCVYEVDANKLHPPSRNKEDAIRDANGLARIDQLSGLIEVHEFDESDAERRNPLRVVHTVRA